MQTKTFKCVICKREKEGYGNNPRPLKKTGKCCDYCNKKVVLARIGLLNK